MRIEVEGNQQIAQDALEQILCWDQAVVGKKIDELMQYCADDVSMFDVSTQLECAKEYQAEWEKFSPYFCDEMKIVRRDVKIYASDELVVMHCHSRIENPILKGKLEMPWSRNTLCLQKRGDQWLVVHQHISMPVDLVTGQMLVLKDKPKLRLVV